MYVDNKPFPLGLCIFAFIVLLLPSQWLSPVELSTLAPVNLIHNIFNAPKKSTEKAKSSLTKKESLPQDVKTLSDEIARLGKELDELKANYTILANENRELKKKLTGIANFMETQPSAIKVNELYELIVADVIISTDSTSWRRSITIDRGFTSGIITGLPVIYGKYLIGKIAECGPFDSRVQLLTDPMFHTKAFTISNEKPHPDKKAADSSDSKPSTRAGKTENITASGNGVLEGRSTGECILKWISREVPVKEDWLVMSASDITGLYPRGLLIGQVTDVDEEGHFHHVTVKPALDFSGVETVIVLKKK